MEEVELNSVIQRERDEYAIFHEVCDNIFCLKHIAVLAAEVEDSDFMYSALDYFLEKKVGLDKVYSENSPLLDDELNRRLYRDMVDWLKKVEIKE